MNKIAYIVCYFGKFPALFQLWLNTCGNNPTVDWHIFTDDKTKYSFPQNVYVHYMTFSDLKEYIQRKYQFSISLDNPYKLCDYRVAYGEIFQEYLSEYDFWGHCDIDLLWGDIRKFITDDVLEKYVKVGFQGHSTLYRNEESINSFYRTHVNGIPTYEEIFSHPENYLFDENIITKMYEICGISYYKKTVFAHLNKYESAFYLGYMSSEDRYKNHRQVFSIKDGRLFRHYVHNNMVFTEEYMYIHFFCRSMEILVDNGTSNVLIVPNRIIELPEKIDVQLINKLGKRSKLKYLFDQFKKNKNNITFSRVLNSVRYRIKYAIRKK